MLNSLFGVPKKPSSSALKRHYNCCVLLNRLWLGGLTFITGSLKENQLHQNADTD
jgi:hypothetical protein